MLLALHLKRGNISWLSKFFIGYLVVTVAYVFFWIEFPTIALIVFLIVSIWHFGRVDALHAFGDGPSLIWIIGFGLMIPTNLAYFHTDEISSLVRILIGSNPEFVVMVLLYLWWFWLLSSIIFVFRYRDISVFKRIEPFLALSLIAFLPPLWGFSVYFVFVHSLRHTKRVFKTIGNLNMLWKLLTFATGLLIISGALIFSNQFKGEFSENFFRSSFVMLAALTMPHMLFIDGYRIIARLEAR